MTLYSTVATEPIKKLREWTSQINKYEIKINGMQKIFSISLHSVQNNLLKFKRL